MKRLLVGLAVASITLYAGQTTKADFIFGSQGFGFEGVAGDTNDLLLDTSFELTFRTNTSQTVDFFGYPPTNLLPPATLDLATADTFSFGSTDFGFFTATAFAERSTSNPETREFVFQGTFTPGTNPQFDGLDPNSARLIVQINQSGGAGNAYGGGASLAAPFVGPPIEEVPEPSTLVMLASLSGPLALVWNKRRRRTERILAA